MRSKSRFGATLALAGFVIGACSGSGAVATAGPTAEAAATAAPATPAAPTVAPTPTQVPMTDGVGPEHFIGSVTAGPTLVVPYTQTTVGDVTQLRGGVVTFAIKTNDVRMAGTVTWHVSADNYNDTVGPLWGPLEVKNDQGTWSGPCTAGGWGSTGELVAGCWLAGSGAYAGFTAYFSLHAVFPDPVVEGVMYPGPAPKA